MGEWLSAQGTLLGTNKFGTDDADGTYLFTPPRVGQYTVGAQLFQIFNWNIQNRSGATALVGLGVHFGPEDWQAGTWTDATTTYTDDTTDAQDAGASDFPLEVANTNNDGHVVAAVRPFNLVSYNVGTAGFSATSTVRQLSYSGPTGWTAITGYWVGPPTGFVGGTWSTGERAICFPLPTDFTPMTVALHGTGVPAGRYGMRIRATTSPTTQATAATQIVVGRIVDALEGVADNGSFSKGSDFPYLCQGDHLALLVTADSDTANNANAAGTHGTISFRLQG